jgi:hypothetical protein
VSGRDLVPAEGTAAADEERLGPFCEEDLTGKDKIVDMRRQGEAYRIMRMQSPKTGMKSWETWDMEGCALAKRTSSATSMGPGMLRVDC